MSSTSAPRSDLRDLLAALRGKRLLVWGDVVADSFLQGTTTRVSREAPALVLRYDSEETRPGGAGNAALNAAALEARVRVFGYLADDVAGRRLRQALATAGVDDAGLVTRADGATPTKTRVMAGGPHTVRQQILRIDNDRPWPAIDPAPLRDAIVAALPDVDAVLISDYGLGSVSAELYRDLRPRLRARAVPVTLDSRFALLSYPGVTSATPNESEVDAALRVDLASHPEQIEAAGRALLAELGSDNLLITRGSRGMAVFCEGEPTVHLPIHGTDEIADVTGAGDTVIAAFTLALAAGADVLSAARLANVAAGLAVMKHGTATVRRDELGAALTATP